MRINRCQTGKSREKKCYDLELDSLLIQANSYHPEVNTQGTDVTFGVCVVGIS